MRLRDFIFGVVVPRAAIVKDVDSDGFETARGSEAGVEITPLLRPRG
jgi:hypothetical protein